MSATSWPLQVFSLEIRRMLSYRVDFWVQFIGTIATQCVLSYFLWRAIFDARGVTEMAGYSFKGLMLYYLLVPLVGNMTRGAQMGFVSLEIYDGGLNRYLIYPVSFFGYKLTTQLAQCFMYTLQFALASGVFLALFGQPADVALGLTGLWQGLVAVVLAVYLYFTLAANLEFVAFWADNVWSLMVMLRMFIMLFGGAWIPLAFFPEWAQRALTCFPFVYLAEFPVRCLMGKTNWNEWALGLAVLTFWAAIFSGTAGLIWRRGLLRYTGVGM